MPNPLRAQQAYTAIGNRAREIMRDPYMLGFEIVTKDEDNTRLVGVFAFKVSGEILLMPVFYLNGQIKGQDLLYRKGVNRFYPNTDKWIAYLKSRGEDKEGRGVDRQGWMDARIHMNLGQLSGAQLPKMASADDGKSISRLWKEATEAWAVTDPEYLFADLVVEQGMQKEAAALAGRLHTFADYIELGQLLKHASALEKAASDPAPELILYREPRQGAPEPEIEEFYKRGFALMDARDMKGLSDAYDERAFRADWATLREPGVQQAKGLDNTETKVLWGPVFDRNNIGLCCSSDSSRPLEATYVMVVLEGPDKGTSVRYHSGTKASGLPVFSGDKADIADGKTDLGTTPEVEGAKPKAGEIYAVWMPSLGKFFRDELRIQSIETNDGVTRINPGCYDQIILRDDTECDEQDLRGGTNIPPVLGSDAVFIPLKTSEDKDSPSDGSGAYKRTVPPSRFVPLTADRLNTVLLGTRTSKVEVIRDKRAHAYDIRRDSTTVCREVGPLELVWKLAHCLALPAAEVYDIYDNLGPGERTEFTVVKARDKYAAAQAPAAPTNKYAHSRSHDLVAEHERVFESDRAARGIGVLVDGRSDPPARSVLSMSGPWRCRTWVFVNVEARQIQLVCFGSG